MKITDHLVAAVRAGDVTFDHAANIIDEARVALDEALNAAGTAERREADVGFQLDAAMERLRLATEAIATMRPLVEETHSVDDHERAREALRRFDAVKGNETR